MFTQLWFWLFIANKILAGTCPKTSSIGLLLNMVAMIARYVFILLMFFVAPHWWYGLVLLLLEFLIPLLLPKINTEEQSSVGMIYSVIGSHAAPFLVIAMYIVFFV